MDGGRRSFNGTPSASATLSRSASSQSMRSMSTRMKKVAPPPPPPPVEKAPPPPLSNGSVKRSVSADRHQRPIHPVSSTPGEDSAIDELLEGRMDLEVVLPDLKVVRMTVDRRTPMMDLLVQATTTNKISPSDHTINLISRDERNVHYKPNTPIGSLDANTVYIIPKSTLELPVKRMPKLANQPFEQQTFRLQVNLPQNQRMVLRVSPRITLAELKKQICSERELDLGSHHLVHPAQPDTILDLNATLDVYGCAEISLMSNSGLRDSIRSSTLYAFTPLRPEEEKKKKGILRLFSRKKRDFVTETPSNGINHLTSSQSDGATLNRNSYQPKQSIKRKPAPAPPPSRNTSPPLITQSSNSINSRPESEISAKTADEVESSVSHSRHSSDSSGYHEPSVFSDCSENKSPEASILHGDHGYVTDAHRQDSPLQKENFDSSVQMKRSSMTSRETSNLKNVPSCSNVSIISASRKRKAPQPPVSTLPAIESPSSPEAPPIDSIAGAGETGNAKDTPNASHPAVEDNVADNVAGEAVRNGDSRQQESEALQYLEDVLQESEKLPSAKIMDDSDTDSLKDEGEVISVCQAEVHANASDHDSPDSIVESQTVVAPAPESHKLSFTPLSNPNSQSTGCEVVDTSADDSGISQSLNSDADSSVPSLNSDYKTMSDSGCQEDIYCNVTETAIPKIVPSDTELPAQSNSAESVNNKNYESSDCDGAAIELSDNNSLNSGGNEQLFVEDQCSLQAEDNKISIPEISQKSLPPVSRTESIVTNGKENKDVNSAKSVSDKSCSSSISGGSHQNSTTVTPQCRRKLDNFVLGSYKKDEMEDIYSVPSDSVTQSSENSCLVKNSDEKNETEVPKRKLKNQPGVRIVSLKEKTEVDVFDADNSSNNKRVLEKCSELNKISTLPLTGRCSSMYNLTPQKKVEKSPTEEVVLEESLKRTLSDQNFSEDLKPVDLKACFLQEQKRLQDEYRRLQDQFISWQKQLMNNQSLLQSENILPEMPFTSLVGLDHLENSNKKAVSENKLSSQEDNIPFDQYKTRSLPRPKTKALSLKEPSRPKTPPLPQSPTEASIVDIDIGSEEPPKRPDTLTSCSVNTQANVNLEDKKTQVPSPQDKVTQVPSPQDKVTSGIQVPSPETVKSKEDVSAQTSNLTLASPTELDSPSSESEGAKSQTLPRPKPKPISAFKPAETMTLNRKSMPRSQFVSVTIGSWQQRQATTTDIETANVASSRSKFQSLESIPQNVNNKPIPSFMEKRKLPPVPNEEANSTKDKTLELVKENKILKLIKESTKPSGKSLGKSSNHEEIVSDPDETAVKTALPVSKASIAAAPKHEEKHKVNAKLLAKEPTAMFKSAKPFVKLSSMKDDSHTPSIIGLRKWPLSDKNESKIAVENKQSILDDLKASSKRPGGYVQETIRRAEVDLRKPRSSKTESTSATKAKEVYVESTKPKTLKTETSTTTKVKEVHEAPSKLHITKVNINNIKGTEDLKQPSEKKGHSSNLTTPVTAPSSTPWGNTIPKSHSLNSELLAAFSKKANKDTERYREVDGGKPTSTAVQSVTVNGSVQPPAPPPPPPPVKCSSSGMPTIPPAEQIPVSSQLLMARETTSQPRKKESKRSPTKFSRTSDPREELMLEIRGFGGKHALRKVPSAQSGWHLKVFGTASTANS